MKKLFVLNCGSSSIKYKLFDLDADFTVLASGMIDRIGERVKDYHEGFKLIERSLKQSGALRDFSELFGAAHRVVHGGEVFVKPTLIDAAVVEKIEEFTPLAPLHNPYNLEGIKTMTDHLPSLPQVAVFDTAFHQSMPPLAYRYALPESLYTKEGIRRFGFHGISHHYLSKESALFLKKSLNECNLITIHLGSGASITAVKNGKSEETSMGFTPLEGLMMATRSGDLDPGIVLYLMQTLGKSAKEVDWMLNHESGFAGLCESSDMREILAMREEGDGDADFAFSLFCRRIKKYIGAYCAILGGVDAIVFSGGIGANSKEVRAAVCEGLENLGIILDRDKNESNIEGVCGLHSGQSSVKIVAMQTDEELEIARQSKTILQG